MNPRAFHALAVELAEANSPADHRTAISRAYYSAFHVGAELLRTLGFSVSRGGAGHGEVARCFSNSGFSETQAAGASHAALHSLRNRADYQLERPDVEQMATAKGAVVQAREIIAIFDHIRSAPNRATIQTAIAAWRKSNGYP